MYRILLDVSDLSVSLNRFVQTPPLTVIINNQMNSVLSMLPSIHLETYVDGRRTLLEPCKCIMYRILIVSVV